MDIQEFKEMQMLIWDANNKQFAENFVNPRLFEGVPMQTAKKYKELVDWVIQTLNPSETKNAVLLLIKQAKEAQLAQWFSEHAELARKKD